MGKRDGEEMEKELREMIHQQVAQQGKKERVIQENVLYLLYAYPQPLFPVRFAHTSVRARFTKRISIVDLKLPVLLCLWASYIPQNRLLKRRISHISPVSEITKTYL